MAPVRPQRTGMRAFSTGSEQDFKAKSAKFFDFIEKAEEVDAQVEAESAQPVFEELSHEPRKPREVDLEAQVVQEALKTYNRSFFSQFAYAGNSQLTQTALEEYIARLDQPE